MVGGMSEMFSKRTTGAGTFGAAGVLTATDKLEIQLWEPLWWVVLCFGLLSLAGFVSFFIGDLLGRADIKRQPLSIIITTLTTLLILSVFLHTGMSWKIKDPKAVVTGIPGVVYNVNGVNSVTSYLGIYNDGPALAKEVRWQVGTSILPVSAGGGSFDGLGSLQLKEGPETIPAKHKIDRHPETGWPDEKEKRDELVSAVKANESGIFVFGRIEYRDLSGIRWKTAFCRIYSGPNVLQYKDEADTALEAYPADEFTTCSSKELHYGPRQIPKP